MKFDIKTLTLFGSLFFNSYCENIKVANWNLNIFGNKKSNNEKLMHFYANTVDDYDIIFLQEIRNIDQKAFPKLCSMVEGYNDTISSRAGSTDAKEQYGVLYKKGIDIVEFKDYNLDSLEGFERPPIKILFEKDGYEFTVYNLHTKPDSARQEIERLEKLVDMSDKNILIIGDLNADGTYYNRKKENDFFDWNWIINDYQRTNMGKKGHAYDRIIINDDLLGEYIGFEIFREGITKKVSDHYLISIEIDPSLERKP